MPQINNASSSSEISLPHAFRMQDQTGDGDLSLQKPAQPKWERKPDLDDDADSNSVTENSAAGDLSFERRSLEDDEPTYANGEHHFSADLSEVRHSQDMDQASLRSPIKSHAEPPLEFSDDLGDAVIRPSMDSDIASIADRSSTRNSDDLAEGGYTLFRSAHQDNDSASEDLEGVAVESPSIVEQRPGLTGRESAISVHSTHGINPGLPEVDDVVALAAPKSPVKTTTIVPEIPGHAEGVSEWSHQQLAPQPIEKPKTSEEDEWQDMPAFAPYDMYDDDGKLVAREAEEESGQLPEYANLGGAARGYTRVQIDEDAQSATSMDEDTAYLFKGKEALVDEHDDDLRDPLAQMAATKTLLTENQRIAYVGVVRLAMAEMIKDAESIERTRGSKKEVDLALDAMRLWGQKMMVRIYGHMELDPAEQMMIEQLADHGLKPDDLTPTLMQNARVRNPMMNNDREEEAQDDTEAIATNESKSKDETGPSVQNEISRESSPPPPPYEHTAESDMPGVRTPSQLPMTNNLDIDIRWTVLCDLFLILISDSIYDARSRALLERVGSFLAVEWLDICRFEKRVSDALEMQEAAQKEDWDEAAHLESRRKRARKKKLVLMGLATVGGGIVIGLSAGLLAPVIGAGLAAGFTTIGVTGTGTFLAGAGGAAVIGTGAAVTGGSIGGRAANKRMGAVKTYEYRPLHNNKRVNLIVTVAGWMSGKVDDVRLPYSTVDPIMGDIYSILWEPEMLRSMGDTINILATEALTQGLQQILGSTILIGLMAALQLPIVLTKLAYLIDNPWSVSQTKADMAGLILADSLIDRNLGARPITLVGFSLGSRLIFSCLRELAKRGAVGLVQNVYMFGSPVVVNKDEFLRARTVVSGRFVNGYATNDWILGYLFRATAGGVMRVAGLNKVNIPGIENVDVTQFVPGHMSYRKAMPRILREVGWAIESDEFSEIEDPDPDNHEKRQRELINEIEEARKEAQQKPNKKFLGLFRTSNKRAAKKKEWETYEHREDPGEGSAQSGSVLFDVEAIRREAVELAIQGTEIKELKTTTPPVKSNSSTSRTPESSRGSSSREPSATYNERNLESALSSSTAKEATTSNNSTSQPSKPFSPYDEDDPEDTDENIIMTFGSPVRKRENVAVTSAMGPFPDRSRGTSPLTFDMHTESIQDNHQTSTSFDLPPNNHHYHTALTADYDPLERSPSSPPVFGARGAASSKLAPAWDDDGDLGSRSKPSANGGSHGNVWARDDDDDDEFGKEKEVEMTFE